jgi:hypothetical protein
MTVLMFTFDRPHVLKARVLFFLGLYCMCGVKNVLHVCILLRFSVQNVATPFVTACECRTTVYNYLAAFDSVQSCINVPVVVEI